MAIRKRKTCMFCKKPTSKNGLLCNPCLIKVWLHQEDREQIADQLREIVQDNEPGLARQRKILNILFTDIGEIK